MHYNKHQYWPRCIIEGKDTRYSIRDEVKKLKTRNCMVFTDMNLVGISIIQELISILKKTVDVVKVYNSILENPSDKAVYDAVEKMKEFNPDLLIYIGGGSVIDLGKAANVIYTHGGTVSEYDDLNDGVNKITNMLIPSIAIPTTAGSGSEVSSVSVITDSERNVKIALISPYIVPTISILDGVVTKSMSPQLTAYTGMDALSHAIEAYVSNVRFEPGRGIALRGVEMIVNNIRNAVYSGDDDSVRQKMLVGSACGAMAFNNNYLGAVHGCAHQLSTVCNIPHGLANAIMLEPVVKWNIPSNVDAYADISRAFGLDINKMSKREAAAELPQLIKQLEQDIGVPQHLSDIGVSKNVIDELVEKAYIDHNMLTNPRITESNRNGLSKTDIKFLYNEKFVGE